MDSIIYLSTQEISEDKLRSFLQDIGGQWHRDPTFPKGTITEGDDVLYVYPPTLPSTEYASEELAEFAERNGIPKVLVVIDIGRSDGSPALAERIGGLLVHRFGGWLDGNGVLD